MKEDFQYDKPSYDVIPTPTVEGERTGVATTDIDVQKRYGKPVPKKKKRLAEEVLGEVYLIQGSACMHCKKKGVDVARTMPLGKRLLLCKACDSKIGHLTGPIDTRWAHE